MDCSPGAPCFFKVFLPELSSQYLTIPPAFRHHLELETQPPNGNRIISLTGPSGNTWCVDLATNSKGLCFYKGWKEFVTDHSIQHGDFLVFRYDRSFHFTIWLFDTTACQKKSAFSASPRREETITPEDSDGGVTPLRKRKRDGGLAENKYCRNETDCRGSLRWCRKELSSSEEITIDCATAVNRHARGKPRAGAHATSLKCVPRGKKMGKTLSPSSSNEARQVDRRMESETGDELRLTRSSNMVEELQFNALRSRRQEVTEQEMDKAFEKAESFKSENPFAKVVMQDSYVYYNFNMHLPRQFVREHISMENEKMTLTLWDHNGKPWMVNCTTSNMRGRFSGRCWRKFSYAHNLETGDICVFELIEENQFKVHIFRVVEALVPLIRVSRDFKRICES